jgi:hypothetical protein
MNAIKLNIFERILALRDCLKAISLWWKFDGVYYHRDFMNGVRNLIKWFPVIWKDRDWDYHFIYEIIKVKLKNQADYIGGHDRHVSAKRDAELMRLASRLIQRCQDDHYNMEYFDYHESNFNWSDIGDKCGIADSKRLEIELVSENFDEYFKKYPRQYKRVMSGEINRFDSSIKDKCKKIIAMEIAHENSDRCRKLVFKIMSMRIEGWWD